MAQLRQTDRVHVHCGGPIIEIRGDEDQHGFSDYALLCELCGQKDVSELDTRHQSVLAQ